MKGSIRQNGKTYSYYFKYKDEFGKWKSKEKRGFATKKEAQSALRKALVDFEETGIMTKKANYTLEQYIDYWFKNVAELTLKYHTLKLYKNVNKKHILPKIGHLQIDKCTVPVLQEFFVDKQKTLGKSSVNAIRNVLSGAFKLGTKQKLIRENPMKLIELAPLAHKVRPKPLAIEDLQVLEERLSKTELYLPYLIAMHTGMRRGEILGLTWDNVNFIDQSITVNKQLQRQNGELKLSSTKTFTSNRSFKMTQMLTTELTNIMERQKKNKLAFQDLYYKDSDFVCAFDDGHPICPDSLSRKINYLARVLELQFTFHDLRHLHATMMLESDVNIKVIQERLGHSNVSTTLDSYSHVTKKLENDAVNKFESFMSKKTCHQK